MVRVTSIRLLAVLCVCTMLCGCGGNINKANYDKIKDGMSEKEVEAILGPGEEQSSIGANMPGVSAGGVSVPGVSMSGKNKVWKEGTKIITIMFMNDKMTMKAQTGL